MAEPVEEDCPICPSSQRARERFATVKVAEHIKEKARRDEAHKRWIEEHTTHGTLPEIREALAEQRRPRQ